MATQQKRKIMTPVFRVSYPNLFKARKADENAKEKFSVVMLFPKTEDISELKKLAVEVRDEFWPDIAKRPKKLKSPFRDGDVERADSEGYAGHLFIAASSLMKPGVVDENVQPVVDPNKIYPGCYGRATIIAYGYSQKGNNGIAFGLQNFQFVRDGDPLGGRSNPAEDFGPVESEAGSAKAAKASHDPFASDTGEDEDPLG